MSNQVFEITIPELHENQARIRTEAKRFNVPNCGRRFGKSSLATTLVSETAVEAALPVAWFAPEYKTLSPMWDWFVERLQPITASKSEQERQIKLITGGVLDMWTLENADAARGHKYARAILDEAAQDPKLLEHWNKVIRPMLIDYRGDAWFLSTPDGKNGFYKLHLLGRDPDNSEWKSWTFTSYDNPFLDRKELDGLRDTMTEEAYRQEILAEFLEGEGAVFRNINNCMVAPITTPAKHAGHVLVAGVDWGSQRDYTAMSVGCATCRQEVARDRFNQIDFHFQRARLRALIDTWKVTTELVELNSIGLPNFQELAREGVKGLIGFDTTATSKAPLIQELALELEKGTVQFQKDDYWTGELEAYEVTTSKAGHKQYSAPDGEDFHDDTVIARALMVRAMNQAQRTQTVRKPDPWKRG